MRNRSHWACAREERISDVAGVMAPPLPLCPICGDPRLASLGGRYADPTATTWVLYACGHRVWTGGKDRRILTTVAASTDLERAKRRHPSAHAVECGSRLAGTVKPDASPLAPAHRSPRGRQPGSDT